jgi:putative ribosome biogenesis GTPase RsgA
MTIYIYTITEDANLNTCIHTRTCGCHLGKRVSINVLIQRNIKNYSKLLKLIEGEKQHYIYKGTEFLKMLDKAATIS